MPKFTLKKAVGSFFPVFKKKFGKFVESERWENIIREVMLKASIINCFVDMGSKPLI